MLVLATFCAFRGSSQPLAASYLNYINQYKDIAIRHQQAYGIPASITLAQGLLESCAGASPLATKGNNHFGIKCHKSWTGDTILHDDDLLQECFRKYDRAEQSFEDHARFLKGRRYASLFTLPATDYRAWAQTLKQCGYATDPSYPDKLIAIIEKYELYRYDSGQPIVTGHKELKGDETMEHEIDTSILDEVTMMHNIRQKNGLHYVTTHKGDTYTGIASEFGIKLKKLMEFNDLSKAPLLNQGSIIYLEEKHKSLTSGPEAYVVKRGDTLYGISQQVGLRLRSLCELNALDPGQALRAGDKIKLR